MKKEDCSNSIPAGQGLWSWVIFAIGLGIFLYFQVGLAYGPFLRRSIPVEADDAYGYILKAAQLSQCFRQDCPALADLRPQMLPQPNDSSYTAYLKLRGYVRLLLRYHPLYDLILLALAKVTHTSLEEAFKILTVLGSVFIALAISYLLWSLTCPASAGVALASMSLTIFGYQGIHLVYPSNLTMGLGAVMLAYLAQRQGRPSLLFYFLNILTLGMHQIGILYTAMAVVFGVACRYPQVRLRAFWGFIPSLAMMALFWVYINLFSYPMATKMVNLHPPEINYLMEVLDRVKNVLTYYLKNWVMKHGLLIWPDQLSQWVKHHQLLAFGSQILGLGLAVLSFRLQERYLRLTLQGIGIILIFPLILNLFTATILILLLVRGLSEGEVDRRRALLVSFDILSLSLIASSLIYFYYGFDDVQNRLYALWSVIAGAIFGQGLVLMAVTPGAGRFFSKHIPDIFPARIQFTPLFWRIVLGIFLLFSLTPKTVELYRLRTIMYDRMVSKYDFSLDKKQPQLLLQFTTKEDIILYDDQLLTILPFSLINGTLKRRAVFLPHLPLPPEVSVDLDKVKLLIGFNPYLKLSVDGKMSKSLKDYLVLPPGASLKLELEEGCPVNSISILSIPGNMVSPGDNLKIEWQGAGKTFTQDLKLSYGSWQDCLLQEAVTGGVLSLANPDSEHAVALSGLRLQPTGSTDTHWPWEGIKRVVWESASLRRDFSLPQEHHFQNRKYRLKVLHDGGASVVWRLVKYQTGDNFL